MVYVNTESYFEFCAFYENGSKIWLLLSLSPLYPFVVNLKVVHGARLFPLNKLHEQAILNHLFDCDRGKIKNYTTKSE